MVTSRLCHQDFSFAIMGLEVFAVVGKVPWGWLTHCDKEDCSSEVERTSEGDANDMVGESRESSYL